MSVTPLKVGLLGAGWFGRTAHLSNLITMKDVEVVAVSSRSENSLAESKAIAGDQVQTFTDWRQLLELDELDAVVIALTNDQHHEAATKAFERGLHVLCEKPLGLTIAQCNDIIAASESAGKILQIGHEMRFQRLYEKMRGIITEGGIGETHLMWCREFRGPMRAGWRSSEALTGGVLLEKNCHHFDLFNWIIDRKPIRVAANGGINVLKDREGIDNAQVLVEYEGGRRATLELCLFAPYGGDCEFGVAGDLGRIDTRNQALHLVHQRFDTPDRVEMTIDDDENAANFVDSSGRVDRGIKPELEHWVNCCLTGQRPLTDGESAKMSVAICLAAQEAIKRAEVVTIDEVLQTP